MKIYILAVGLCCLALVKALYNEVPIPKNGTFFYVGLDSQELDKGQSLAYITLGSDDKADKFRVKFDTNQYFSGMSLSGGDKISNGPKIDHTSRDLTYGPLDEKNLKNEKALDYQVVDSSHSTVQTKAEGEMWLGLMSMQLIEWDRSVNFTHKFVATDISS